MNAKIERYRNLRGAFLRLLAKEHPGTIDMMVMRTLLDALGLTISKEELHGHAAYLAEKEFIKSEKRRVSGMEISFAAITAKGLDLLDGLIKDVGVNTERHDD